MVRTSEPLHIIEITIATVRRAIQKIKTSSTHSICLPYLNGIRKSRLTGFVIIIQLIIYYRIENQHIVRKTPISIYKNIYVYTRHTYKIGLHYSGPASLIHSPGFAHWTITILGCC